MCRKAKKTWFLLTPASPANDHCDALSRISVVVHGCSQIRSWVGGADPLFVVVVVVATACGAGGGGGGGGTDEVVGVDGSAKNAGGGGGGGGIGIWTSIIKF